MKKDMIFFSTDGQGLTSTSANHIANMAKEMVRNIQARLGSLRFYSTSVALIDSDSEKTLTVGATADDLESIPAMLRTVAKANSLIAWLREAIKARESLLDEVDGYSLEDYCKDRGIDYPKVPLSGDPITSDDYFASLSVAERNRYYELETLASVIGQAVHPDGCMAEAREELARRIQAPNEVNGSGRDTLIYTYTPTVAPEAVDDIYFRLQKLHRETQATLNAIKFECSKAVRDSEIKIKTEYANATQAYSERMTVLRAELAKYKSERTRAIGNYKILIPESLQAIYDEVSHLGKK